MAELRGLLSGALSLVGGWQLVVFPRGQYSGQVCSAYSSMTSMNEQRVPSAGLLMT